MAASLFGSLQSGVLGSGFVGFVAYSTGDAFVVYVPSVRVAWPLDVAPASSVVVWFWDV